MESSIFGQFENEGESGKSGLILSKKMKESHWLRVSGTGQSHG